jgi:hypothetical protein
LRRCFASSRFALGFFFFFAIKCPYPQASVARLRFAIGQGISDTRYRIDHIAQARFAPRPHKLPNVLTPICSELFS